MAAAHGCASAGLRLIPVVAGGAAYPLQDDPALLRETRRVIADTGTGVGDLEIVMLRPDTDVRIFEPFLEAGGRLGARHVLVAGFGAYGYELALDAMGQMRHLLDAE